MRSISMMLLSLALCAGLAGGARAEPTANPNWSAAQQFEWRLGYVAQASNACGTYDESAVLLQIARMSPYGEIGLDAASGDALDRSLCEHLIEEAKDLVAKAYRIRGAIEASYHCSGKECYGQKLAIWVNHTCGDRLRAYLAEHAVKDSDILEVIFTSVRHSGATLDFTARVRFKSCQGSLYVDMRESCYVERDYTRGNCEVAGVSAY